MAEPNALTISVRRPSGAPLPPPESANYFGFSFIGGEIQLLVGAVDLDLVHEAVEKSKRGDLQGVVDGEYAITADITHRFLLSAFAFEQLNANVTQIAQKIKDAQESAKK